MKLMILLTAFYFAFILPLDAGKSKYDQKSIDQSNIEIYRTVQSDGYGEQDHGKHAKQRVLKRQRTSERIAADGGRTSDGYAGSSGHSGSTGGEQGFSGYAWSRTHQSTRVPALTRNVHTDAAGQGLPFTENIALFAVICRLFSPILNARSGKTAGAKNANLDTIFFLVDDATNGISITQIAAFANDVAKLEKEKGKISSEDIANILLKLELTDDTKTKILNDAKTSCGGKICLQGVMMTLGSAAKEEDYHNMFNAIDTDHDTLISKEEMMSFLDTVVFRRMGVLITKDAKKLIRNGARELMQAKNEALDIEEFIALISGTELKSE